MDRKNEQDWSKFLDLMIKRCTSHEEAYEKLCDFVSYLNYTEAIKDCSEEFLLLFRECVLNPIVEGHATTFSAAYDDLCNGKELNLQWYKAYSGNRIMTEGDLVGQIVSLDKMIASQNKDRLTSISELLRQRNRKSAQTSASSCGSSSSSSRCGVSSSSSCHSSSGSSSRCGTSSSSCGGSLSRC